MPKLIPASTCGFKRMAGYWMLYRDRRDSWGKERGEEIFLARCVKRMGNLLQTDGYDNIASPGRLVGIRTISSVHPSASAGR